MSYLEVIGGRRLQGGIRIQGSKNAALPILSAAVLHSGVTVLKNCPKIIDVKNMLEILRDFGCRVDWEGDVLIIDASGMHGGAARKQYARKMRSSIMLLVSLLGRVGSACLPYPGGCVIGERPIDLHLAALRQMGARVEEGDEGLLAVCESPKGAEVVLPFPSVGATENVILLSVLSEGITVLDNAAREPEIEELCRFLNSMGACIRGGGSSRIVIAGVEKLHDTEFTIGPDRIVAGTYMLLTAAAGGRVFLEAAPAGQLKGVLNLLGRMGVCAEERKDGLWIGRSGRICSPGTVQTEPYPGFPTDLQSPLMAVLAGAEGESRIRETIFEARFKIVEDLKRMGADICTKGQEAVIRGREMLHGETLAAQELRGGAALVLAAAAAEGSSRIRGLSYIERGYENIVRDLQALGVVVNLREENEKDAVYERTWEKPERKI